MKSHWENIYSSKQPNELSWTQKIPQISLDLIKSLNLSKSSSIIDVGGGQSMLVDFLIDLGYTNISVLDLSKNAISKTKRRLGENAKKVNWIETDILDFKSSIKFDLCHDRALFHFLTKKNDVKKYINKISLFASKLVVGTFSIEGPKRCSGLEIRQYNQNSMKETFERGGFKSISFSKSDHLTPSNRIQKFIFGVFENSN
ncbi:MAG: class I SAM-dependent methyltransferase [Flavobacteriaceae bacterium]|jgi:SAM-dependent methyltransferase|nr:class I SAM-dependent methyltransferase [Flavobacteriaceae bacterium]